MRRLAIRLGLGALVLVGMTVAAGAWWLGVFAAVRTPPVFDAVRARYYPSDLLLLDRHGDVLSELRTDPRVRRLAWTSLDEVSPALLTAVVASEDRRFWRHGGVDARAVAAAIAARLTGGAPRGASTISMQVASLVDPRLRRLGGPRTLPQKWRQMRLAWRIEAAWGKREILEAYLNLIAFRGELNGVRAAASVLYGKAPHGLDDSEAAVLAALIRAPAAGRTPVTRRAQGVLAALGRSLPEASLAVAVTRAIEAPRGSGPRVALAPHAAARLLRTGPGGSAALPPASPAPPTVVASTLDASVQRVAVEALRQHLAAVRDQHVRDGAVLVVDNATGDVLAYVGGSGELSSARHVDGIRARRQAGSTLKPLLYGLALERRLLTLASSIEDTPLELAVAGGLYRPRNYDEQFRGLVSVRTALASSLNVPAVRTLDLVGADVTVDHLRQLGFEGLHEDGEFYGPSLALGSADVSLWELVGAYRALARGGEWTPLRLTPGAPAGEARAVYSDAVAFLVADVLADRESRSATFGLENPLATRFWTAVKTGTSKEMRDNWCIGFSSRYTVGVWVGNFSGEPMRNVSGVTGAAPVWREVMSVLHAEAPSRQPAPPAAVVQGRAGAAGRGGPDDATRTEWFLAGTEPDARPLRLAAGQPRIVAPVSGAVVALDPDIPPDRQRLVFEAHAAGAGTRWVLDAAAQGPATGVLVWPPVRGRHTLALTDAAGRVLDTVTFEVRGAADRGGSTAAIKGAPQDP